MPWMHDHRRHWPPLRWISHASVGSSAWIAVSGSLTPTPPQHAALTSALQTWCVRAVLTLANAVQALREKMERDTMIARYARANTPAASISYPHTAPVMQQAMPGVGVAGGVGYIHGAYAYPQMMAASDPRVMMYPSMPRVNMYSQPRLSGRAPGLLSAGGSGELRQGRMHEADRDRDAQPRQPDAWDPDMRSRSRNSPGPDTRHTTAHARGPSSDVEGAAVPTPRGDTSGGPHSEHRENEEVSEDAPPLAGAAADGALQRRHSSGVDVERDAQQVWPAPGRLPPVSLHDTSASLWQL